jgi:prepilin-type N-terminal cleavage/methylation domain-containing protein
MNIRQSGFTLIELMIGLLLGTVLIAAVAKVFLDSGNTFRKQKSLSYLVEDGRYIQEILAREFRRLGYLRNRYVVGSTAEDIFKAENDVLGSGLNFSKEEFVLAKFDKNGFNDAADINHIVFRYQLNDKNELSSTDFATSPCTKDIYLTAGEDPATQKILITLFFYVKEDADLNTAVLYCKAKRDNLDDESKNKVSNAIPLISNIEKLYILYGADTDNNQIANQYLRADQVTDWKKIVSLRFYLVLASEEKNITVKTPNYVIDGREYNVSSPADKRLYRVFSSTIAFRNLGQ